MKHLILFGCILSASLAIPYPDAEIIPASANGNVQSRAELETSADEPPQSLPVRIQTAVYNGVRTVQNVVRFVPATVTDFFKNFSRTAAETLRRNVTVVLITESPTTIPTTTTKVTTTAKAIIENEKVTTAAPSTTLASTTAAAASLTNSTTTAPIVAKKV